MATIVLSAAGAALGSSIGGSVLGLSASVIGQAIGATIGQAIDQRVLGAGSETIETGKIERFRLTSASEGTPIPQLWGKMRVSGQVIWASRFLETTTTTGGGGKGAPATPTVTSYTYTVSLAIALCEGEIASVGRIWADGVEISATDLNLRVYKGDQEQLPDPKIEALEGAGAVPAFRGTAYVVVEALDLGKFGNRVPQFSFEVHRRAQPEDSPPPVSTQVQGVAMIPGTGEYSLATQSVHVTEGPGDNRTKNVHTPGGQTDFKVSVNALDNELPNCGSVSLVVSWFGDDLRCGDCRIRPKVERHTPDGVEMPYLVGLYDRPSLYTVPYADGRPVYGGTPSDQSVIQAIKHLKERGKAVVYYPFILMDQMPGNSLPDPWSGEVGQPALPWRGRITLDRAPGLIGSPDQSAAATGEVSQFFGTANRADFFAEPDFGVFYTGTPDWRYRFFILHQAALCKAAGGVDAFCIGSEMRSLTQIRGADNSFPAVDALRQLAADVRAILGPDTKISYAADWSEYFGYHPQDGSGDVFFHLDPLWADPQIDFIGIDNYMPLSDWRDGLGHRDAEAYPKGLFDLDYLQANIEGGEGFDWYYRSASDRDAQIRTEITDGAHEEPWVFRYKDLRSWWQNLHYNRSGGVREAFPTNWEPQSKPIWFTEVGCAALNKSTNQPNKFLDLRSSESQLPYYSDGRRDDTIQHQYYKALLGYWSDPARNPVSEIYEGPMIDTARIHAWCWDARPYPYFPNKTDLWSDGESYARGHWIMGRMSAQPLAAVVAEVCERSGIFDYDVSELYGLVRGYVLDRIGTAREALQPLMLTHGFEAIERNGTLVFRTRREEVPLALSKDQLAISDALEGDFERVRAPDAELAGRVQLQYVEDAGDYETRSAEAIFPDETSRTVSQSNYPLAMTYSEGKGVVERWLAEARVARESIRFALPPSGHEVRAGDLISFDVPDTDGTLYRVDRVEEAGVRTLDAMRVASSVYTPSDAVEELPDVKPFQPPLPVYPVFLDLPLITGEESPQSPHLAVTARPWPGSVAVYRSADDAGYELDRLMGAAATIGLTETALQRANPSVPDLGPALRVKLTTGALSSVAHDSLLRGANTAAVGDGSPGGWELLQFRDVVPVAPNVYDLTYRLRGQLGTEAEMQDVLLPGSHFVLLSGAVEQIEIASQTLGLPTHFRIGPAQRPYDDSSYTHVEARFEGRGLRPYSPVHLSAEKLGQSWKISFIRRTRVDGDRWDLWDVPLGEEREQYRLEVRAHGNVLRDVTLTEPSWIYTNTHWGLDGAPQSFEIAIAQISDRYGPGPYRRITVHV